MSRVRDHGIGGAFTQFRSSVQKAQFDQEQAPSHRGAKALNQFAAGAHGASGGQQVVHEQDPVFRTGRVFVYLDRVRPVFEFVTHGPGAPWQLAGLADGDEAAAEPLSECRPEDEASGLGPSDPVDAQFLGSRSHPGDGAVECLGVQEDGGDVLEDDPFLGEVGNVADEVTDAFSRHGPDLSSGAMRIPSVQLPDPQSMQQINGFSFGSTHRDRVGQGGAGARSRTSELHPDWLGAGSADRRDALMDVVTAPVLYNRKETASVWRLGLGYDAVSRGPCAARFVMLASPTPERHLIPRPFSISDVFAGEDGTQITEILYKPIGRVTGLLSELEPGEELSVGGLLGNGFPIPQEGRRPVLVAGGIGNAPFALQVRELVASGEDPSRIVLFLAGRTDADIWIQPAVREAGVTVVEVTDDGSRGERGLVTEALARRLEDLGPVEVYACGPGPMLHAVSEMALDHGFPCWLATEERMACGYGVCNACIVERRCEGIVAGEGPYAKSCVEGPVFEAREIRA